MIAVAKRLLAIKLLRYFIAGGTAFLVEYLTFLGFYYYLDLGVFYSNTISFSGGLITSFTINRFWVFDVNATHGVKKQVGLYIGLALSNLIVSTAGIRELVGLGVSAAMAKVLFIGLIAGWNYVLFKRFIFKSY